VINKKILETRIPKFSYTPVFISIAVFVPLGIDALDWFARDIRPVEKTDPSPIEKF
jgi:ACS family hexuronate transporter-like MFS transporter